MAGALVMLCSAMVRNWMNAEAAGYLLPCRSSALFYSRGDFPFLPSSLPPFFARSLLPTALTPARPLLQAACVRLRGIRAHMRERGV